MGTDHLIAPAFCEDRVDATRIRAWTFVPVFLVVHGIIATCVPSRLDPLSTIFIVLGELAAIAACIGAARSDSAARVFWQLLIGAIILHSAAMSLDAASEIRQIPILNHIPAFSILFSLLYGLPLLVAVSLQNDSRVPRSARLIHTFLSIAVGAVIYLEIFSFLSVYGSPHPSDVVLVTHLFDAMDVFLALAGTIRWFGTSQAAERRFFRVLATFLWTNAVCCAVHNRVLIRHDDWIWLDLLIVTPYVILVPLIQTARSPAADPPPALVHAVRSGSPMFLASILVCAGVIETRFHFWVGFAAALFAIVGYGILNILVQSRGLATEESLMASKQALERLVDLDGLTGIANRRAFDDVLRREFAATMRNQQPLSLLMIDVDLFKNLNDSEGHLKGDEYLVQIAGVLGVALPRATDFVARYGGEEFAVILSATNRTGAMIAAEKARTAVAELELSHPTAPARVITVSIGVSTFDGSAPLSPADLTEAADCALYIAKRRGRNSSAFKPLDSCFTETIDATLASSRT
jgi:diguanylate cyclase (GGDEF)-like protein